MVKEPGVQDPNAKIASDGAKQSIANVRHEKRFALKIYQISLFLCKDAKLRLMSAILLCI